MATPVIAIVAPGAMGSALAARLHRHGARVLTCLEGRSAASGERARASGMQPVEFAGLLDAELFLSVVPPDQALPLAARFAAQASAGAGAPPYLDLNAVNPAQVGAIAAVVVAAGTEFVDGCVIGPPPAEPSPAPTTLHLSGASAAAAAATLRRLGLDARDLAAGVGAASALKMAYAGINKGLVGLAACMLLAARRHGAEQALLEQLQHSQPGLLQGLRRSVPDMLPKAWRWVPEMQQIRGFVGAGRPESAIYAALAEFYQRLAELPGGDAERDALGPAGLLSTSLP